MRSILPDEYPPRWWHWIGRCYGFPDGRWCYKPHRFAAWRPVTIRKVMGPLYVSGEIMRRIKDGTFKL